jgi:anionic cell wall polymer biosynthesis LytR-Cps2A-Psr (LCP) family protein
MIVASYNPRNKDVTMISIPRDLYVKIDEGYYGRINSILQYYLNSRSMSMTGAMEQLKTKVGDIIGQDITYYGLIDFK